MINAVYFILLTYGFWACFSTYFHVQAIAPRPTPPYNEEQCDLLQSDSYLGTVSLQFQRLFTGHDQYFAACFSYLDDPPVTTPYPKSLLALSQVTFRQGYGFGTGVGAFMELSINTQSATVPLFTQVIAKSDYVSANVTKYYQTLVCNFPSVKNWYTLQNTSSNIVQPIDTTINTKIFYINTEYDPSTVGKVQQMRGDNAYNWLRMYFSLINTKSNSTYVIRITLLHNMNFPNCNKTCTEISAGTDCKTITSPTVKIIKNDIFETIQETGIELTLNGIDAQTIYFSVINIKTIWGMNIETRQILRATPTPSPVPSRSPSPNPTPAPPSDPCFPGDATVFLKSGEVRRMKDLEIGDLIETGEGEYSPVFFFSHRVYRGSFNFLRIEALDGQHAITVSSNHYLRIKDKLIAAKEIKVGDYIQNASGRLVQVTKLSSVSSEGLFAPHTMNEKLIVDGIYASVFTTTVHPALARFLLTPLKLWHRVMGNSAFGGILDSGNDVIRSWMPKGPVSL